MMRRRQAEPVLSSAAVVETTPVHRPWWKHPVMLWGVVPLLIARVGMIAAFRRKWPPAVRAVKTFNRNVLNPQMLRMAGKPGWYAARVETTGRRSGEGRATPVVVEVDGEEMLIPLPYGTDVDWCQNVLASGHAAVIDHGTRYLVSQPEIISFQQVAERLSPRLRSAGRIYHIDYFLRLHAVKDEAA